MSDRDYIIQEIRKLFKEQMTAVEQTSRVEKILKAKGITDLSSQSYDGGDTIKHAGGEVKLEKDEIDYLKGGNKLPASMQKQPAKSKETTPDPQKQTDRAQPGKTQGKTTPAKDANPTEDFPFQVVQVEDDFPNTIIPGMDRRDKGFGKKGASKSINSAAIEILGPDPRVIYTALINSGVIDEDYLPKEDLSDLPKLIAKFQEMASQGKLRFQKKIDPTGELAKGLTYTPTDGTREIPNPNIADSGSVTANMEEQKAREVTVDGKIGSRTAKMLNVYAKKENFDQLKKKAGVKPTAKDEFDGLDIGDVYGTAKEKPEGPLEFDVYPRKQRKKQKMCDIKFASARDIREKTLLALKGLNSCALGNKQARWLLRSSEFTDVSGYLGGKKETKLGKSYILSPSKLGAGIKERAAKYSNDPRAMPNGKRTYSDPKLLSFYNYSFSNIFTKFYAGHYTPGKGSDIYIFCTFNDGFGEQKAIAYKTEGGVISDAEGLLRVLQQNKFLSIKNQKDRTKSILDYKQLKEVKIDEIKSRMKTHLKNLTYFKAKLRKLSTISKEDLTDNFKSDDVKEIPEAVRVCLEYLDKYMYHLRKMYMGLGTFTSSPTKESLNKLNLSANIVGGVQSIVTHGGEVNAP
jgi:hypothetical protein